MRVLTVAILTIFQFFIAPSHFKNTFANLYFGLNVVVMGLLWVTNSIPFTVVVVHGEFLSVIIFNSVMSILFHYFKQLCHWTTYFSVFFNMPMMCRVEDGPPSCQKLLEQIYHSYCGLGCDLRSPMAFSSKPCKLGKFL